jgi:hypothetical protein
MNKFLESIYKYKRLIGIIAIILIVGIAVSANEAESGQPAMKFVSINTVMADTIKDNPELAAASGVRGIVEVGLADLPESGSIFASRGERVTIPIFISFTSYDPDLKSLDVLIDLSGEVGPQRWEYWYEYDAQGEEINSGVIRVNDLISYDREGGIVTIEAGGRVEFNMFVDIPSDLPPLESITLPGCGISKDDKEPGILLTENIAEEIKLSE